MLCSLWDNGTHGKRCVNSFFASVLIEFCVLGAPGCLPRKHYEGPLSLCEKRNAPKNSAWLSKQKSAAA